MELLEKYLKNWELDFLGLYRQTKSASIYQVVSQDKIKILKISNSDKGPCHLLCGYNQSSSTVHCEKYDEQALLMEYIDGPSLTALSCNGVDLEASMIISSIVQTWPGISGQLNLPKLKEVFEPLFTKAKYEEDFGIYSRAAKTAQELLDSESNIGVLHGDVHHDNILHSIDRGWLLIDPKGIIGEKTYELANCFFNPMKLGAALGEKERVYSLAEMFSEKFSIDKKRILKFAFVHGLLSVCLSEKDQVEVPRRLEISSIIEPMIYSV